MALNAGLGFNLSATDQASGVFSKVGQSLGFLKQQADQAGMSFDTVSNRWKDANGRFTKPQGMLDPKFMKEVAGHLQGIGVVAGAMGGALAGGLGYAANEATKFGLSMGKIASITDRAAFPMSEIERITKEMAATYGGDINLQADTFYQAVSSGANDTASAVALMHNANKLAIGGLSDSFAAVDALTNVLNAYGMQMTRANEVSDALFTTAKIGKTDITELASQIGRVAPTANAAGVSMDEMFAVITAGSSQLGNAAAPIDGLKEMLSGILKPTTDAAKEAKRLGIEFNGAALRSKGFKGFFDSITSSAQYNQDTFSKLFGSMTAFNLAAVLASNGGAGLTGALEGMAQKAGSTDYAFNTLADTADFAQKQLKGNLQTALVSIGQVIAPIVGKLLQFANVILQKFNAAPPFVHKLVAGFALLTAGSLLLVSAMAGVALGLVGLYTAGMPLVFALGAVAIAFGVVALAAVPFILLGAAIYTAWNKNIGGFADKVTFYFDKVKLAFDGLGQALGDGAFSGKVMGDLNKTENQGIKKFVTTVFLWFNRAKNFVKGVGEGFTVGLSQIKPTVDLLVATFTRLWNRFSIGGDSAEQARGKFAKFGAAGQTVGNIFAKVVGFLVGGFNTVMSYIDGLVAGWDTVTGAMGGAGLGSAVSELFAAFQPLLQAFGIGTGAASDFGGTARVLGAIIGGVLGGAIKFVTMTMSIFNAGLSLAGGVVGSVFSVINMLYRTVYSLGKIVIQVFSGDFSGALLSSRELVGSTVNSMIDMFASLVLGIAGAADSIAGIFGKQLNARDTVKGYVDQLKTVAGASMGVNVSAGGTAPEATPAAVIAQQQAADAARIQGYGNQQTPMAAPPITANITTKIVADGAVLHETTEKARLDASNRGFSPHPGTS